MKLLRSQIHSYGGPAGLRFAQAVQLGVVNFLFDHLQRRGYTPDEQERQVREFLNGVTKYVRFVEEWESMPGVFSDVDRALRDKPIMFFLAGAGRASHIAVKVGDKAYASYICFSRRKLEESGRAVYMLALEPPDWIPPEVIEKRKHATAKKKVVKKRKRS